MPDTTDKTTPAVTDKTVPPVTPTVDTPAKKTDREIALEKADKKIEELKIKVNKLADDAQKAHDELTQALRDRAAI